LEVSQDRDHLALRTVGDLLPWSYVYQGPSKRLAYLSFNCFAEEYDALVAQVKRARGVTQAEGVPYVTREGFWFHDPDGNLMQLKGGPSAHRPPSHRMPRLCGAPAREGCSSRSRVKTVHPQRLSM